MASSEPQSRCSGLRSSGGGSRYWEEEELMVLRADLILLTGPGLTGVWVIASRSPDGVAVSEALWCVGDTEVNEG